MSDQIREMQQLNGFFKHVYLEKKDVRAVMPEVAKLSTDIPFSAKNKIGKDLLFPVMFTYEQGFTHASGSEETPDYNDVVSATSQEATVEAYQIYLKSLLSLKAAARSLKDEQAFERETKHLVENMVTSFRKRQEMLLLYGKEGLGVISAKTDNGSTTTITISQETFAPLLFSAMENSRVDIILANKSGFSHATARNVKITIVDIDARQITLDADIAAVINVGDHVYLAKNSEDGSASFVSAGHREMPGIKYLLTYSGSVWGINNSTYRLWKGTEFSATNGSGTSALSFNIITRAVAKGVSKGLDGKARCYISHLQWSDLINDEAAARRLDSSYDKKKLENGASAISFFSQNGEIEIIPHGMVKGGDAFILQLEDWERVGSEEMTFNIPGKGGEIFTVLTNKPAYMLVLFSDQVLFCKRPACQVYIKDLTYTVVDA